VRQAKTRNTGSLGTIAVMPAMIEKNSGKVHRRMGGGKKEGTFRLGNAMLRDSGIPGLGKHSGGAEMGWNGMG